MLQDLLNDAFLADFNRASISPPSEGDATEEPAQPVISQDDNNLQVNSLACSLYVLLRLSYRTLHIKTLQPTRLIQAPCAETMQLLDKQTTFRAASVGYVLVYTAA